MNTVKHMDAAKAAALFGSFAPPPRYQAHPPLGPVKKYVLSTMHGFEMAEQVFGGEVRMESGEDGLRVVERAGWLPILRDVEETLLILRSAQWKQFLNAVDKLLPGLAVRYRRAHAACVSHLLEFLLTMSVLVGTDFAECEGVDLSTPFPEDVGDGPSVTLDL